MAKLNWPRVVTSLALSATAAGFLVWRIFNPAAPVDAWTVALVIVIFLPWLRTVFASIGLPGGAAVTYLVEKVEKEQERQSDEIEAMRFLLDRFIERPERELLERLARGETISAIEPENERLLHRAFALHKAGMIAPHQHLIEMSKRGETTSLSNMNEMYEVTRRGRQYLDLNAKLPNEVEEPSIDPTRPSPSDPFPKL